MALRFVASQPALAPLFVAVGLGIGGSVLFAGHYLKNNQDVVIRKNFSKDPWNNVSQGQNTKMFSWNKDLWDARQTLPDPRAMFKETAAGESTSEAVKIAKANAIKKAKMGKEQSAH